MNNGTSNYTKIMKIIINVALAVLFLPSILSAQKVSLFDGNLALVEIVKAEPFDASLDKSYVVASKPRVHNLIGSVNEIYDGAESLLNTQFPMTPPPRYLGDPEKLTHDQLSFEGVADANRINVGAKGILILFHRKDIDPMKPNFNPYRFPDRSIFFALLAKPGFTFDNVLPEFFSTQKSWAEAIKQFNTIEDDNDRIAYLKQAIRSENPLLAVTAVHLFKRFYPQEAEKYFDEIILAPGVPVYARLAMDHEFCLSRGQAWVNGKQKDLEPILEKEAPEVPEGTGLLSFRKQMIDNGSWFGGRGERE